MATKQKNAGNKRKSVNRKSATKRKSKKGIKKWVVFAVIALVVINVFTVKEVTNQVRAARTYDFDKAIALGVDVSTHNGKIDWSKLSKEVDFAFIRVGYRGYGDGDLILDDRAKYNMSEAQKYGVPFGVYIYSQAITVREARQEAKFLLKHIKGYKVELPLVYDFEYANSGSKTVGRLYEANLSEKKRTKIVRAFCRTVKHAGHKPGLYASSYIFKDQIKPKNLPRGTVIWVADYNKKITYNGDYDIWQYSATGKVKGIKHDVDLDRWYQKDKKQNTTTKAKDNNKQDK